MAFWSFGHRTATAQPATAVEPAAYDADVKRAYEHGRLDERSRRRRGGFGPLSFILLLAAVIGVVLIVFAVREGSFSAGGAVVDNKLDQATSGVAPAIDNAASKTGTAMETAGQNLKDQGAAIAGNAPDSGAPANTAQ
ncbi:MAG TPA: hypothetical protein VHZ26_04280 [Caulobacteraceae bacterium]|nr:hypothetical protein [Caulobacteraceae bacterium]